MTRTLLVQELCSNLPVTVPLLPLSEVERGFLILPIYSGPDGFIRKHTNKPYSASQIGLLVVCLPSQFAGGIYMCDTTKKEHITLNYSPYVVDAGVGYVRSNPSLAPRIQPLKAVVMKVLGSPELMNQGTLTFPILYLYPYHSPPSAKELVDLIGGIFDCLTDGILGVFCSYAYPTAPPVASNSIEHVLKDGDYLLYSAFKSCGLDTSALLFLTPEIGMLLFWSAHNP
ncbi:hypothetical protein ASPNIDRAFT_39831 [Aspergillus niger ATCC 1015]|uniref:Uncharacterized protein n=1 Tax=Aspergillus niger (strain ATCC 1015 / CBS 113.46 / FGSC A1144 / LSHB Ac4 / NCTC 3858a / NRRL 328 / USDA 3528.7) TaxID=380704 RepID=G3XZ32_ASPNA|nr:hypothetical protein ASPNIDRAFT_39831 [Aspergillus niger ATCC 1015]